MTIPSRADLAQRGFAALNSIIRPAVQAGAGNPLVIGAGPVVLETTGRRSGLTRRVPLLATRRGATLNVSTVRSNSLWLRNIESDRKVAVWLGGQRRPATASVVRGPLNVVRIELATDH